MLTFALFGAGRIGRIHARNVASQPRARLKYVVDPNGAAASELAAAVGGAPAQSEDVFDDPDVDAIVIASSAETHAELIMRAIESRKAIFCEKPVERSTERTRACARSLHEAGSSLFLGFQRRFDPSFAALRNCSSSRTSQFFSCRDNRSMRAAVPLPHISSSFKPNSYAQRTINVRWTLDPLHLHLHSLSCSFQFSRSILPRQSI